MSSTPEKEPDKERDEEPWAEDDPAMAKAVRAQRKRPRMKVDGASVKTMLRVIGERARKTPKRPGS